MNAKQTNSHKTEHPRFKPLTPEQENAIDLLCLGKPDREICEIIGIGRSSLWTWRKNPVFIAELNRRRQALWAEAHGRLQALVGKAIDVIEQSVAEGDVRVAIEVLKTVGIYGTVGAPRGSVETEQASMTWSANS
jgi:hypothetical protein